MADKADDKQKVNFSVDPNKVAVYFTDAYLITSNDQTLTFNFAQSVFDGQQQTIVSRVAMTLDQAKGFLKNLNDHIEKFER
jgi:hypothetical protein